MSRKDYEALAAAIRKEYDNPSADRLNAWEALERVTQNVADVLAAENPRFNRERFLAAALGEES